MSEVFHVNALGHTANKWRVLKSSVLAHWVIQQTSGVLKCSVSTHWIIQQTGGVMCESVQCQHTGSCSRQVVCVKCSVLTHWDIQQTGDVCKSVQCQHTGSYSKQVVPCVKVFSVNTLGHKANR